MPDRAAIAGCMVCGKLGVKSTQIKLWRRTVTTAKRKLKVCAGNESTFHIH